MTTPSRHKITEVKPVHDEREIEAIVDWLGCVPGDEVITSPLTFPRDIAHLVEAGVDWRPKR